MGGLSGPALCLAQLTEPETLEGAFAQAGALGYRGVQLSLWDPRFYPDRIGSRWYRSELAEACRAAGVVVSEIAAHVPGQLLAMHPALDTLADGLSRPGGRGDPRARAFHAVTSLQQGIGASAVLGLPVLPTLVGALATPFLVAWPPAPQALIDEAFADLAAVWLPLLRFADEQGVDIAFEVHPGTDICDGTSFERFLDHVGGHPRATLLLDPSHLVVQGIDPSAFVDAYHERIRAIHVKDAAVRRDGRQGFHGGFAPPGERLARSCPLGEGEVDFPRLFDRLAAHGVSGWAAVECSRAPDGRACESDARTGAAFVERLLAGVGQETTRP